MLFFVLFLTLQNGLAHELKGKIYEEESAIGLYCKYVDTLTRLSNNSCAATATAKTIYNYGFLVQNEKCMVCRAGGTPGEDGAGEGLTSVPLYVDGEIYLVKCIPSVVPRITH